MRSPMLLRCQSGSLSSYSSFSPSPLVFLIGVVEFLFSRGLVPLLARSLPAAEAATNPLECWCGCRSRKIESAFRLTCVSRLLPKRLRTFCWSKGHFSAWFSGLAAFPPSESVAENHRMLSFCLYTTIGRGPLEGRKTEYQYINIDIIISIITSRVANYNIDGGLRRHTSF